MDSVDSLRSMFRFTFGPYGRRIVQHSGEAVFDVFERKFPAISAIYFAQDDANDIDKSLQGRASLARFLMVIVGWWKKATDMCNDLVTENEGPFMGWTDGHAAPLAASLQGCNLQCGRFRDVEAANRDRLR
jgi:hypothetical protein